MGLITEAERDLMIINSVDGCTKPLVDLANKIDSGLPKADLYSLTSRYFGQFFALTDTLRVDPRFGQSYVTGLGHDVSTAYINAIQLQVKRDNVRSFMNCRVVAEGLGWMIQSVACEVRPNLQKVDLGRLTDNLMVFADSLRQVLRTSDPEVELLSSMEWGELDVLASRPVLFRIMRNLTANSTKSVVANLRTQNRVDGGWINMEAAQTEDNRVRLDIMDNGVGFGHYLEMLGIDTTQEELLLEDILNRGRGITGFTKVGEGGSGFGLSIVERMARVIGAQVIVANPKYIEGGKVSLYLPTA